MLINRIVQCFRLTRRQYFADFFITPPLTLLVMAITLRTTPLAAWAPEIAVGFVLWTAYEYALHRWGLHGLPVLREIHALHHRRQQDYIAVPPWTTLTIYLGSYLLFGLRSTGVMAGFSLGYVAYAAIHTACHYAQPGGFIAGFERRHVLHHRFANRNFGVTTSLWDRVFRTEARLD